MGGKSGKEDGKEVTGIMHINLILIPFVIILGLLLGNNDTAKNRKWYIIICSAVLLFVAAFRSAEWMTFQYQIDTLNYKEYFERSFDMDWSELWSLILGRYVGMNEDFDIGFIGLEKIIGLFTSDFYIYSFLADLLFFVPFGIILYRYCTSIKQVIFAFVFYIALIQTLLWGGARQVFSIGFDLMAFLSITDRKRILTIIFLLLGVSIHFSSLLFVAPLMMIWLNTNPRILKMLHAICFLLFPVVLMMPNEIIVFMGNASGLEKYADYGGHAIQGGATTFIVLIEFLSLFSLFSIKQHYLASNKAIHDVYVMAPLFTLLAPLIHANGSMTRIALYYYLFLSVLVPYAIDCMFKGSTRNMVYTITIGVLSLLVISNGGMTYLFYWQF